ncbi:MAG TPA: hypothetical protein VJX71_17680, partial [Methylomirabilota bacterium]|nr:hypothetical protein [Methylomirabilota bacterium]
MRIPSIVVLLVVAAPLAVLPASVSADSLDLKTHPAERERVAPSVPDRDLYPQRQSLPQRPQFIKPLSRSTPTGQAGVAGYTAPNPPVGSRVSGDHDNVGWPSVG